MSINLDDLILTPEAATGFYRLLGRALWAIGHFESQLAHIIVIVFKSPFETIEDADNALETEFSKTLGNLLREFRNERDLSPELDRRLEAFKKERDWLCHRIYRENEKALFNRQRFECLCNRLDALKYEATDLADMLDDIFERWRSSKGISDAELNSRIRKSVEEWKK